MQPNTTCTAEAIADALPTYPVTKPAPSALETTADILIIVGGFICACAMPIVGVALYVIAFVH